MQIPRMTWSLALFILILGLGIFLRTYRFNQTLMFQGDQGRDALVVRDMIKNGDVKLIGPVTSVGNMYLGPFYYYFMAPFLWLTYPNPSGPAYGVWLMNILSLPLLYITARGFFDRRTALLGLLFYALMDVPIWYSRFSWNPNLSQVVTIAILWTFYRLFKTRKLRFLLLASLLFGILTQLHYMALIFGLVLVAGSLIYAKMLKKDMAKIGISFGLALVTYMATFAPLVIFDLSHNGLIHKSFVEFMASPQQFMQPLSRLMKTIEQMEGRAFTLMAQMMGSRNGWMDRIMTYGGILFIIWLWRSKMIPDKHRNGLTLVATSLLGTIILSAFYRGTLFDHYLLFATPVLALYWGYLVNQLLKLKWVGLISSSMFLLWFSFMNITHATTFADTGPTIAYYQKIVNTIEPHLTNGRYNIVLLSDNKDYKGMNYRYFFTTLGHPPEGIDDYQNLHQLVVIDELNISNPLSLPLYEIQQPHLQNIGSMFELPQGPRVTIYQ